MTQTPEPDLQPVSPVPAEPPTVAISQPAAPYTVPSAQPASSGAEPTSAYAAPGAQPASPYAAPGAPASQPAQASSRYLSPDAQSASPYGAPGAQSAPAALYGTPPASPYAAPAAQSASPYGGPGVPSAQPAWPYSAPTVQPASPYAAPTDPTVGTAQRGAPDPATVAYGVPPVPGQPVSSQPAYGMPAAPGQPVSGQPAFGYPYAEQPLSAPPYGMAPAQPKKPRRTGLIALVVVAALLLVSGGVLGALLVAQRGETSRANTEIAAQRQKVAEHEAEIDKLKVNLDSVNSKNLLIQQELDGSKNDREEQERQKKVVGKCLDLLLEAFAATSESLFDKRIAAADKTCDEADRYR